MRRDPIPVVEGLEGRRLLTAARPAVPMVHAAVVTPLVLTGTLAANAKAATITADQYGDRVVAVPVAGVLGNVGRVRGTWTATTDPYGNRYGPNTLALKDAQGTFTVTFDPSRPTKGFKATTKAASAPFAQHVHGGTKGHAHATEAGLIVLNKDAAGKVVRGMTLTSDGG